MSLQKLNMACLCNKAVKQAFLARNVSSQLRRNIAIVARGSCHKDVKTIKKLLQLSRRSTKIWTRSFHRSGVRLNKQGPGGTPGGPPPTVLLWAGLLSGLVYLLLYAHRMLVDNHITFNEFVEKYLKHDLVKEIIVNDESNGTRNVFFRTKTAENNMEYFTVDSVTRFENRMKDVQYQMGKTNPEDHVPIHYRSKRLDGDGLIIILMLIGMVLISSRHRIAAFLKRLGSGGMMGMMVKSPAKLITEDTGVKFKDVAGCEEAKVEIMEFVNFLKNPKQYIELGAKVPKGALLNGPPGTGKTLLAKATAGEAGVPFIAASGSEFLEMFVGVGPDRVRKMFAMARENAPCILFIDEIDAIGIKRSSRNTIDDERSNTLNQLLVEMDGFETERGVIVMAATNRLNILDSALLRPGRFDRQIYVGSPDIKGRTSIFKVHLKNIKTAVDKDELAKKMASLTPGFSGAEIMNVCNEAALIAVRHEKSLVCMDHFEQAIERVVAGMEKKSRVLQPSEKKKIAFHEAGKAVTGWFLEHAAPILKISLVPRGDKLSFSMSLPREKYLYTQEQLMDIMCSNLGGVVAEEMIFGSFTSRGEKDLQRVTKMAYSQVTNYGMSEKVGNLSFDINDDTVEKPYSQQLAELIDVEVKVLVDGAYQRTKELLAKHKEDLEMVAHSLLEKEKMDKETMVQLLGPRPFTEQTTYEEMVEGTGSTNEDTELPPGLDNWNKFRPSAV
ncbi:AFG3-like protein 2 [Mya arenaria]|uniref:AFG3-like protein 2 n=1 Tax=Mya arenaria TaxID=6604 RepID=UPI0022E134E0|nr:AFG3-like protein 2 [Mya arenaria]